MWGLFAGPAPFWTIHGYLEHIWQAFHLRARLFLVEGDALVLRYCADAYPFCPEIGLRVHPDSLVRKIFEEGKPVNLDQSVDHSGWSHSLPEPITYKSVIPLKCGDVLPCIGEGSLGVLVVDAGDSCKPIDERDFQYLNLIGVLLSEVLARIMVIERIRVIQREKKEMAEEAAHIFRNGFTVIGGFALRLTKALKDPALRRYARVIPKGKPPRPKRPSKGGKNCTERENGKMNQDTSAEKKDERGRITILVALDFSECSRAAYRRACDMFQGRIARIIALHVIDSEFLKRCVANRLGEEGHIKKDIFMDAKKRLREFLEREKRNDVETEAVVSEGVPYLEINKKALACNVDLILIGSCGGSAGTEKIFFGTTAEKVLRFITRPVLCIPPEPDYK